MRKVLILLAGAELEAVTAMGQGLLRDFRVTYQLRVGSGQVAPDYVRDMIAGFQKEGGQVVVCVGEDGDALFVSAVTTLPVLNVRADAEALHPFSKRATVAALGQGAEGFAQAAIFVLQILALQDPELSQDLQRHRHSMAARMIAADQKHRVNFDV